MVAVPWLTFTAVFDLSDFEGAPATAAVTCEIETPLVWAATGKIVSPKTKTKSTTFGKCSFVLPFSDQPGFTAGFGGASITGFGFKFSARPTQSKPIIPGSETFVVVPQSFGPVVNIGNLINVGAWPNATIVIGSGGGGTPAGTGPTPVTINGYSGYWSQ